MEELDQEQTAALVAAFADALASLVPGDTSRGGQPDGDGEAQTPTSHVPPLVAHMESTAVRLDQQLGEVDGPSLARRS